MYSACIGHERLWHLSRRCCCSCGHGVLVNGEDHGTEPWIIDPLRILSEVLRNVSTEALRDGRRHRKDLLCGIARQALLVESSGKMTSDVSSVEIDESETEVPLRLKIHWQVKKIEKTIKSFGQHLCDDLLGCVAIRNVT